MVFKFWFWPVLDLSSAVFRDIFVRHLFTALTAVPLHIVVGLPGLWNGGHVYIRRWYLGRQCHAAQRHQLCHSVQVGESRRWASIFQAHLQPGGIRSNRLPGGVRPLLSRIRVNEQPAYLPSSANHALLGTKRILPALGCRCNHRGWSGK